jgi:hypothetical protein
MREFEVHKAPGGCDRKDRVEGSRLFLFELGALKSG